MKWESPEGPDKPWMMQSAQSVVQIQQEVEEGPHNHRSDQNRASGIQFQFSGTGATEALDDIGVSCWLSGQLGRYMETGSAFILG